MSLNSNKAELNIRIIKIDIIWNDGMNPEALVVRLTLLPIQSMASSTVTCNSWSK